MLKPVHCIALLPIRHIRRLLLSALPLPAKDAEVDTLTAIQATTDASSLRAPVEAVVDGNGEVAGLISAHLNGDPQAFPKLVSRYQTRLLNFVYRMIGDRERAEDLVQEAFIRVHRHLHRFDQTKKFSTWIYTIASNLAKNELRNRSRSPLVLYQSIRSRGEEDTRPLPFEATSSRPDDLYPNRPLK